MPDIYTYDDILYRRIHYNVLQNHVKELKNCHTTACTFGIFLQFFLKHTYCTQIFINL
jgi:hypothetical protein